jgi:hypothetical protein
MSHQVKFGTALVLTLACASVGRAQWEWEMIHPAGEYSTANGAWGNQVGGMARLPRSLTAGAAILWNGAEEPWQHWQNLHSVEEESIIFAVADGIQAGAQGYFLMPHRAGFWRGTPESWVELHPPTAAASRAMAVSGGLQGGYVDTHAVVWSGTAASLVDLHPPGAAASVVLGMHMGQQVGRATLSNLQRASLWTGSSGSWVDLTPAGAGGAVAKAVHNGVQVGHAVFGVNRAGMWTGTAASWTSLHPPDASDSSALAVHKGMQAGYVGVATSEVSLACVWSGSPESVVYLPPRDFAPVLTTMVARGITENGPYTIVVGDGLYTETFTVALMWKRLTSSCYANCDRSSAAPVLTANDFGCFLNAFAAGEGYANCDLSTGWPMLTPNDFVCFLNKYVTGCS